MSPANKRHADSSRTTNRKKRRRRILLILILACLAAILILIALAPTLMSIGPCRRYVVNRVSKRLNGTLKIESWSITWLSGFELRGVKLHDAQGEEVLEAESVFIPATIPALLSSTKRLGKITVTAPSLDLVIHEDGTLNLATIFNPPKPGKPERPGKRKSRARPREKKPRPRPRPKPQPAGFDLQGEIAVENATVRIRRPRQTDPLFITRLSANAKVCLGLSGQARAWKITSVQADLASPLLSAAVSADRIVLSRRGLPDVENGRVQAALALADLARLARSADALPPDLNARGYVTITCALSAAAGTVKTDNLKILVSDLHLDLGSLVEDMPPIQEHRIELRAAAETTPQQGRLIIESLDLTCDLIDLSAAGSLLDWSHTRRLKAEGRMSPNFDRLGPIIAALSDQKITLRGKRSKPFRIDTSLAGNTWTQILRATSADTVLGLDRLEYRGIETGPVDITLRARAGEITADLRAEVSGGRLHLQPRLDCTVTPPLLTLPENITVLDRVGLTDELADKLLSRMSPVFKDSIATRGQCSLLCRRLRLPLAGSALLNADMEAVLAFDGVSFRPAGFVETVLDLTVRRRVRVDVPDQRVVIALRNGRFFQSPLTIRADRYALITRGSIGLDSTLDYTMEIPVTGRMLGKKKRKIYDILKRQGLRFRVTGTLDKPRLARTLLDAAVSPLLQTLIQEITDDLRP